MPLAIIKDEKITFKDDKITITTVAAGDMGYVKEYQYIRLQSIMDMMGSKL